MTKDIVVAAKEFVITTEETAAIAGNLLKDVKRFQKDVDASFKPLIESTKKALKDIEAEYKQKRAPFDEAERILKAKIGEYYELQRKREEEEKARLEAELRARMEEEQLAMAEKLEANGYKDEAEQLLNQTIVPVVTVEKKTVSGVHERVTWSAKVVDMKAFLKAVIDGIVPMKAIKVNESYLNSAARAFHEALNIPGVIAVKEKSLAVRT